MSNFLNFNGRMNREKYFLYIIIFAFFSLTVGILFKNTSNIIVTSIIGLIYILLTIKAISINIQRLHDLERPGSHIFLNIIPIYNIYLNLILLLKKGTEGSNKYGNDPLM